MRKGFVGNCSATYQPRLGTRSCDVRPSLPDPMGRHPRPRDDSRVDPARNPADAPDRLSAGCAPLRVASRRRTQGLRWGRHVHVPSRTPRGHPRTTDPRTTPSPGFPGDPPYRTSRRRDRAATARRHTLVGPMWCATSTKAPEPRTARVPRLWRRSAARCVGARTIVPGRNGCPLRRHRAPSGAFPKRTTAEQPPRVRRAILEEPPRARRGPSEQLPSVWQALSRNVASAPIAAPDAPAPPSRARAASLPTQRLRIQVWPHDRHLDLPVSQRLEQP